MKSCGSWLLPSGLEISLTRSGSVHAASDSNPPVLTAEWYVFHCAKYYVFSVQSSVQGRLRVLTTENNAAMDTYLFINKCFQIFRVLHDSV